MKFVKFIFILIFISSVYSKEICRCKYNWNSFQDCCYKEPEKLYKEKFSDIELYQMMLFGVISAISNNFPDLTKPKTQKQPKLEIPVKDEPESFVEFPKIDTIEEMENVIYGSVEPINFDLASEKEQETYNSWIKIFVDMESDTNIENFRDEAGWDLYIRLIDQNDLDWSILPNNYQQIVQLYRKILFFKKMLEQIPIDPQAAFIYYTDIRINKDIEAYNKEKDFIVRNLNGVRWVLNRVYDGFVAVKLVDEAKVLYDRWNNYILTNLKDDNYFQYSSKTSQYLAMIFARWIEINVNPKSVLPPGIPKNIAGNRRSREDNDNNDDERPSSKSKTK